MGDDFFADFDEEVTSQAVTPAAPKKEERQDHGGGEQKPSNYAGNPRGGRYPDEVYSEKIQAEHRTFFVDVKDGRNGKFVKISEKVVVVNAVPL